MRKGQANEKYKIDHVASALPPPRPSTLREVERDEKKARTLWPRAGGR